MRKDKKARHMASMGMVAWANLVGSMALTMHDCDVQTGAIRTFLDTLEESNERPLDVPGWEFASYLTLVFREMPPRND